MRKDHIYRVSFERHINCHIESMVFHCWAQNAKEAKETARETWYHRNQSNHKVPFMFHLEAHRADVQNVEDLRVVDWLQREFTGMNVMYQFRMLRSHCWRH